MSPQDNDKLLRELIGQVTIPPGLRPADSQEVEALLVAMGGDEFSDKEVTRILKKVKAELPVGRRKPVIPELAEDVRQRQEELLALHRSQGRELPPEIMAKLEALRQTARKEGKGDNRGE